jgi:hypothetical protein
LKVLKFILMIIAVVLIWGSAGTYEQAIAEQDSSWPMAGGNSMRTGMASVPGPDHPTIVWSVDVGGSPVIDSHGRVAVASTTVRMFDADGNVQWETNVGDCTHHLAFDLDGTLFGGCDRVRAISPDGSIIWESDPMTLAMAPPVIDNHGPLRGLQIRRTPCIR